MDALRRLRANDSVKRLWDRDATLFSDDPAVLPGIAERLGWLGIASGPDPIGEDVIVLAAEAAAEDITDIVLLGMGGSSLAPLVVSRILAGQPGQPRLHVLDTTAPATVDAVLHRLDAPHTLVLVASKSGTTIEPDSLYRIFREWADVNVSGVDAGRRFAAITDPGTPLESLAREAGFRQVLAAPPDVGGRFSALTVFGLAPASLMRVDVAGMLARARAMENACRRDPERNPAALLAAFLTDAHDAGRDKLTLVTSPAFAAFGLWVEQLIAESTGKRGGGLVPVLETEPSIPVGFGTDRAVVVARFDDDETLAGWAEAAREGSPVHEIVLDDVLDLGGEFIRWEIATGLIGHLLGIDPFDQPNVAEAKAATSAILDGSSAPPEPSCRLTDVEVTYGGPLTPPAAPPALGEALAPLMGALRPSDYLALLAYVPENETLFGELRSALKRVSTATRCATCLELGPRYLHSTGQLHKGGPDEGVFLMVTARGGADLSIPGRPFSLGRLYRAQAEGDLVTLSAHGRRVLRVDLPSADARHVRELAETLTALAEG